MSNRETTLPHHILVDLDDIFVCGLFTKFYFIEVATNLAIYIPNTYRVDEHFIHAPGLEL